MPRKPKPQEKTLGQKLLAAREAAAAREPDGRMPRRRLAERIGCAEQSIFRRERDLTVPSAEDLCRHAAALGCSAGDLLD